MKRIAFALLMLIPAPAWACDHVTRLYGTSTTIDFCLWATDGTALADAITISAGEVKVSQNEGAEANCTTGTGACVTDEGSCYSIALDSAELDTARTYVTIIDSGALPHCILVETYGHASLSQHAIPTANLNTAQTVSDLSAPPSGTAGIMDALSWMFMLSRNKIISHKTGAGASTQTLYKDDGSTAAAESDITDDGTDYTRPEYGAP